jgi:hypothetical protein
VSGSGQDALKAYAAAADQVILAHPANTSVDEIDALQDLVSTGNQDDVSILQKISAAYTADATGLAVLPVPQEAAAAHLALINAFWRTGAVISDFALEGTDPLTSMLALDQYPQAVADLGTAFANMANVYAAAGIVLPAGAPGAEFINLSASIATPELGQTTTP